MKCQLIVLKYAVWLFGLGFLIQACVPLQMNQSTAANARPTLADGKCSERLWIPDRLYYDTLQVAVYTGSEIADGGYTRQQTFVERPANIKWIKKQADRNCLSKNPEDCLVWCLVEVPEISSTLTIVTDTTQTDAFKVIEVRDVSRVEKRSTQEFKQVVCKSDPKYTQYELAVSQALHRLGYINDEDLLTSNYLAGLKQFQAIHFLPEGYLDLETLAMLNIEL